MNSFAADFKVDGIYYNKLGGDSVAVSYRGTSSSSYSNEYSGSVTIPATVTYSSTTYRVTSIGDEAFDGCSSLTEITIPNSVTTIGNWAFYRCSSLTEITIPNSVTTIGDYAFCNCSSLTAVTIGNSVTSIGYGVFEDCSSLTAVTIGNSVTSISESAFDGCRGLTSITIPESVTTISESAFDGCYNLTDITWNAKNYADISSSSSAPFDDIRSQITAFTFGNEVEHIPAYLCFGMNNLTTITIPNSVTSIGDGAFDGCSGLTSVTIGENVTIIGSSAFSNCSSLTMIIIPNSVESIGGGTFNGCKSIETIIVETSNPTYHSAGDCIIETATKTLHTGCKNSIIPTDGSVTIIGNNAFHNCSNLAEITIPNSVTTIGDYAFSGCRSLTAITIPNNLTAIGNEAFSICSSLSAITIPNSVTSIGNYAFYDCYSLTEITIPESVTSIGNYAFYCCDNLTAITISNNVTSISTSAFQGCTNLTEITIPNSVTAIGDRAFSDCFSLTTITIGESVTSIGDKAFYRCSRLTKVTIPNSVITIGDEAFLSCSSLSEITCKAVTPPTINLTFYDVDKTIPLYVPAESVEAYQTADFWKEFTNIQAIREETEPHTYTVTANPNNEDWGFVTGGGEYEKDSVATIEAIPNKEFQFKQWNDGNNDNPRTITVTKDITLIAKFEPVTGVRVYPSDKTAEVYWDKVKGATQYLFAIAPYAPTAPILASDGDAPRLTCTITNLSPDTDYTLNFMIITNVLDNSTPPISFRTLKEIVYTESEQVETIQSAEVRKVFHNGTIYIFRNGEKYTIDGRKL